MIDRTIAISDVNKEISRIAKGNEVVAITLRGKPKVVIFPYAQIESALKRLDVEETVGHVSKWAEDMMQLNDDIARNRTDLAKPILSIKPRGIRAFLRRLFG